MEAIVGQINTFPDAHSGVAQQQEDIGGQIIAAEQWSVAAEFHDGAPGAGLMCCATAFAYC
jgi:hypothetical protein